MDGKIEKVPVSGMLPIEHPANADGFIVSVPISDPDPSLAGMPDLGYRGPMPGSGHPSETPPVWTPTPLDVSADRMGQDLATRLGRVTAAQHVYDRAAMLFETHRSEQEKGLAFALTGVTDPNRRKEIEHEHDAKRGTLLRPFRDDLVAKERVALKAAEDLDRYAQRIAVSVKATPPQLPESLRAKASELLPMLKAEVESLPLGTLRDRLRLALIQEDDAAAYVLATLLPPRLDTRTPEAALTADGRVRFDSADDPAKSELRSLIRQARDRFKDASLGTLAGKARASRDKAGSLRSAVTRGKRQRSGQPAPFDAVYQKMTGSGPLVPWTAPEPPKPRPPTVALNPETGKPLKIPEGVVLD